MTDGDPPATPEQAIWAQLQRHVYGDTPGEGRTADGKSRWANALPYLRRYAAQHALHAGQLDDLLKDPEFLVHADAGTLGDVLAQASGAAREHGAEVAYRASYPAHRTTDPDSRRQILLVDAARLGQRRLAEALHHDRARAVRWATGSGRSASLRHCLMPSDVAGPPGAVAVRASGTVAGRSIVVTTYQNATDGHDAVVWDLESGRMVTTLGRVHAAADPIHGAGGRSEPTCATIATVDDGTLVVVGYDDGTVHAWDVLTGQPRNGYGFAAHPAGIGRVAGVTALTFLPGNRGPRLITGGRDGALRVWDAADPRTTGLIATYEESHLGGVSVVAAAPIPPDRTTGGRDDALWQIVSGGVDGVVRSWELSSGDSVDPMRKIGGRSRVTALGLAQVPWPHAAMCLAGREDGSLTSFDPRTGVEQARIETDSDGVADVVMLRDRPHAVTGNRDGVVTLWDLRSGEVVRRFAGNGEGLTTVAVVELAGRPHVVSGSGDGAVRVWDLDPPADGESHVQPVGPGRVRAVGLSPDGSLIAAISPDGTVVVRHVADGSPSESPVTLPVVAAGAKLTLGWLEGEGPLVASTTDDTLTVYGPLTADHADPARADQPATPDQPPVPLRRFRLAGLHVVAVNGDGGRALVATSGPAHPLEIWSYDDGRRLWAAPCDLLAAHDPLRALALGPPRRQLVAGVTSHGLVMLWDYGRQWAVRFLGELPGATALALGHVRTGNLRDPALCLAVGLDNGAVVLWSLDDRLLDDRFLEGREPDGYGNTLDDEGRLEIVRCPDPVRALAVAPDGSIVVAQGPDLVTLDRR